MEPLRLNDERDRCLGRITLLQAERIPDRTFLMVDARRYSFGETNQQVNRFARGLRELGVGRGDRVAIYMHGRVEFIFLVLAINKLGAIWIPINTDYKGDWLRDSINDSKAKVVVTDDELLPRIEAIRAVLRCESIVAHTDSKIVVPGVVDLADFYALAADEPDMRAIRYDDTAAILWTSGTTGKPKGVMQSHNAWVRSAESGNANFSTVSDDVTYNCLPLYNSAAWSANIFRALAAGIPCGMDRRFSVSDFWDRLRFYGATQTQTLGAMHIFLWRAPARDDDADNPLRVASMVPIPDDIIAPFCERFGIDYIVQGYGQSEAMVLMTRICKPGGKAKPNSIGKVASGLDLKLLDDEGNEVGVDEVGEFSVKPHIPHIIFNGYFDQPEATANAFTGEWYRTGDLGRRDADGDHYFVDRKKDYIRFKGRSISSFQVEAVALKHPAVMAAAAFGIRSEELESESEIKLNVVLKPGTTATPEEITRFINQNAPYFCVPRYVEICAELPYTPTNKVEKYKLRNQGVTAATWDRIASGFELEK